MKNEWSRAVVLVFFATVLVAGSASAFAANQTAESAGANTQDPRAILRTTQQAVASLRTLTYHAVSRGEAGFATGSIVRGDVAFSRLGLDNSPVAKMAIRGVFFPAASDKGAKFRTAFDGTSVYKLVPREKALLKIAISAGNPDENNLSFVTTFFGGGAYSLMMFPLITPGQFVRRANWPVVHYDGKTMVSGALCHVIYAENRSRTIREWWYIGVDDTLPREVESVGVDAEGRWGANSLILSNLRPNVPLAGSFFRVSLPKGYSVRSLGQPRTPSLLPLGTVAPDWKLQSPNGRMRSLGQYRGRVVVMDFWGTWCTPCVRSLPGLERIYEEYSGRDVAVFGVDSWEPSNPEAYVREKGYKFPILLKGETIAKAYHVTEVPTVYVVGADGKIIYAGEADEQHVSAVIGSYLEAHHE